MVLWNWIIEYYSRDSTGYYNAENAYDKYDKAAASKWGCSVLLKNTATGFSADGITLKLLLTDM